LYDWKLTEHQLALSEMAQNYLDTKGDGFFYWPNVPAAPNYNKIRYLEHFEL